MKRVIVAISLALLAAPAFAFEWATPYTWSWATGV